MVAEFQHGLIRLDVVVAAVALVVLGLGLATVWMRLGVPVRRRIGESVTLAAVAIAVIAAGTLATKSWDTSESRANSFSRADEAALARIAGPITIEVHLAPEDPRRVDLERRALSKLRRVRPDLQVRYLSATSIGLFEQTSASYGEIWYDVQGRKAVSRSITAEALLETLYSLAGVAPPAEDAAAIFRGHPLMARPTGAAPLFYILWPALAVAAAVVARRTR
jgi:hypothetical protein